MQWQKSQQYQGMPHDQYLQTGEGRRSQQAFAQWNDWQMGRGQSSSSPAQGGPIAAKAKQPGPFDAQRHVATGGKMSNGKPMAVYGPSAPMGGMALQPQGMYAAGTSPEYMAANPDTLPYRPGAAQPKQPPSQGSPYAGTRPIDDGLLPAGGAGGPAWSQGKASPPSGQYAGRYRAGVTPEYMAANPDVLPPPSPQARPQGPKQTFQMGGGNLAYAAPDKRPPPFTQSASFGGMSGPAQDMFDTRAAFVQSVNNARAPHAAQWGQGAFAPPPSNFGQMMGQAQDMVKSGWQNPLSGLFPK